MSRQWLHVTSAMGVVLAACLSAGAQAGETKTYTYDALGRLIVVQSSGTVNSGDKNSLCYDAAGNRKTYRSSDAGVIASCVDAGTPAPSPTPTPTPTPTNSPPVANPDAVAVMCGNFFTVNVTANDMDAEGNIPLTVTDVTVTSGGAEAYVGPSGTIDGPGGWLVGISWATYTVKDSHGAASTGSLKITTNGNQSACSGALLAPAPEGDEEAGTKASEVSQDASTGDPPSG